MNSPDCLLILSFVTLFFSISMYSNSKVDSVIFTFLYVYIYIYINIYTQYQHQVYYCPVVWFVTGRTTRAFITNTHTHTQFDNLRNSLRETSIYWEDPLFSLLFIRVHRHHFHSSFDGVLQ